LPRAGRWREILNSDARVYGGGGLGNLGKIVARSESFGSFPASAEILLPPLAALFFEYDSDELE
jgi:1,4-alpha-glucan branching enzyme